MDLSELVAIITAAGVVATAVATVVSIAVAAWWRKNDRPEPDWAFTRQSTYRPEVRMEEDLRPWLECRISNAGDGTAFRMGAKGAHCEVLMFEYSQSSGIMGSGRVGHDVLAALPPGDGTWIRARCTDDDWPRAEITIEWTASPTRLKRRVQHVEKLADLAERPDPRTESA